MNARTESAAARLNLSYFLIPALAVACLLPQVTSATALLSGVLASLAFGNPYLSYTRRWTSHLLQIAVMGLGAGMNLAVVGRVGMQGFGYTVAGISLTLLLGTLLGRVFGTERDTSLLVTVGTAICGGSAIAAVASTIRAKQHEVSVALGTVFILNAIALFIFPPIGHHLGLTEQQFGLWSALAIHDTSSVVGATLQYGSHAMEVGTTVKLARALWIVPFTLLIGWLRSREGQSSGEVKAKRPWFILGFLAAAAIVTWVPTLQPAGHAVEAIAKRMLVLTLFLIGIGLTRETLRAVGIRPLLQGVTLWAVVASGTLLVITLTS